MLNQVCAFKEYLRECVRVLRSSGLDVTNGNLHVVIIVVTFTVAVLIIGIRLFLMGQSLKDIINAQLNAVLKIRRKDTHLESGSTLSYLFFHPISSSLVRDGGRCRSRSTNRQKRTSLSRCCISTTILTKVHARDEMETLF